MASKKTTQEAAARAKPGATNGRPKGTILWDSFLKGFGLICRKNGETKTWISSATWRAGRRARPSAISGDERL